MYRLRKFALLAMGLASSACMEDAPTGLSRSVKAAAVHDGGITVLTRNMYFGAALDRVIGETDPMKVPEQIWRTWRVVESTDPNRRVRAIAEEIAREKPDVVGLQEVALWRIQLPGDNYPGGGNAPATDVAYDFLAVLMQELQALDAIYDVAVVTENWDVEGLAMAPPDSAMFFADLRLTDRDAILVRRGLTFENARSGQYAAYLPVSLAGGAELAIRRGWTSVDVKERGEWIRVANTHLEQEFIPAIQEAQGNELLAVLAASPFPVIVAGDLNSVDDGSTTRTYDAFRAARYVDPGIGTGPTCCQAEALGNATSEASVRIDYVLARGPFERMSARVIGDAPLAARPLWPSDHFGVLATYRLKK